MSLVVDNIWNEMKNIGNSKARVRALKKVNRLLSGSKGPITKAQRSTRSNIRPNQPIEARNGHVLGPNALRPPNFTSTSNTGQEGYRGQTLTTETGSSAAGALLCGRISAEAVANKLLTDWMKYKNAATDTNVSTRKAALLSLSKGLCAAVKEYNTEPPSTENILSADPSNAPTTFLEDLMGLLMDDLAKTIFKGLTDPTETCREAAICAVTTCLEHVADVTPHLAYLFPAIMARGVPPGSFYDPELELFAHDADEHEAFKRGRATERQDRYIPLAQRVPEESEELRLSLCQMVGRMVVGLMDRGTIGVVRPYFDDIILFLVSWCNDLYSAVKVEALGIIAKMAADPRLEQGMKFYAVGLSRMCLPHLRHRHSKVRVAALKALQMTVKVPDRAKIKGAGTAAIVDLVGFREDNVLPVAAFYGRGDTTINFLAELATDQSVSVRLKTIEMLGDWLTSLPDRYDHQTRLLPYVLNAIADDAEDVSAIALETVSLCGEEYEREHQSDVIERRQFGVDGDIRANHAKPLPRPFSSRPRIGARLYVRGNTRRFLTPLLAELSDWMSRTRLQSAKLFRTLVVYCEEHLTVEIHKLIPYLQRALEAAVGTKVRAKVKERHGYMDKPLEVVLLECCELVGRYVVADSYLPHVLARIREEPEVNPMGNSNIQKQRSCNVSRSSRAILLTILSKLVEGTVPKVLVVHMPGIFNAITGEPAPVRIAGVRVFSAVARCFESVGRLSAEEAAFGETGRLISIERSIESATGYLLACSSLGNSSSMVEECLSSFAKAAQLGSAEMLATVYATNLAKEVCKDYPIGSMWRKTCYNQLVLEALFATCPHLPSTCSEMLSYLVCLCEQIVTKISSFKKSDREGVLRALVGTVVLRAIRVWSCDKDAPQDSRSAYHEAMDKYVRRMLDLYLDSCWDSTCTLRQCKLEVLGALMESKAWNKSWSVSVGDPVTAAEITAAFVDLIDHLRGRPDLTCKILRYIAQILRMSMLEQEGQTPICGQSSRLIPFSARNAQDVDAPSCLLHDSTVVTDAFKAVLARLDDNDDVRHSALQTLGEFLPYVKPDVTRGRRRQKSNKEERACTASSGDYEADESPRAVIMFTDFVMECVTHGVINVSPEDTNELDTLLRRTACLDPSGFKKAISRFYDNSSLPRLAPELLKDLADHADVLSILQKQGS